MYKLFVASEKKVQWVRSINNQAKAVYEHRAYTKDKKSQKKGVNWYLYECAQKRQKRCGARMIIDLDTDLIVKRRGIHSCPLQIGLYQALQANNEKREATKNARPSESAMEIVRKANRKLDTDSRDLLPSLDNQRRGVSKYIEEKFPRHPPPPKTLQEIPYRKSHCSKNPFLSEFVYIRIFAQHARCLKGTEKVSFSELRLHFDWTKVNQKRSILESF